MPLVEDTSLAKRPLRGLRNASLALMAVLVITAILWSSWAWIAHRRLQARIDAIKTLHQPFDEKDFAGQAIPDDQNAAALWNKVFAVLPADSKAPSDSNLQYNDYPPYPPEWYQLEDQSVVLNQQVFRLADRAAMASRADWGSAARSPFALPQHYNQARNTSNILCDSATYAHLHGDDALAMHRCLDVLQLSRALGQEGTVIGRIVAIGISAELADRVMNMATDLGIEGESNFSKSATAIPATRASVERLIRILLDETDDSRLRGLAVDCDRLQTHLYLQEERKRRWSLGPMIDLSEVHLLDDMAIDRLASQAGSDAGADAIYRSHPMWAKRARGLEWDLYYDSYALAIDRYVQLEWKAAGDRRATAIALAIRLYRADHGNWPVSLNALVPDYLPALPADPFSAEGLPIGYVVRKNALPDGHDRPMLYFNPTGDPQTFALPATPTFCWWSNGWQWRDLSRWYPLPVPKAANLPPGFRGPPGPGGFGPR